MRLTGCALDWRSGGSVAEKDQPEEEAPARRDFDHRDGAFLRCVGRRMRMSAL